MSLDIIAGGEGFEPPDGEQPRHTLSKRAPSATQTTTHISHRDVMQWSR